jgi:hypothetical protein
LSTSALPSEIFIIPPISLTSATNFSPKSRLAKSNVDLSFHNKIIKKLFVDMAA